MGNTDRPLADRVALVTGASRGIGKGTALELGAAGATVYLTARDPAVSAGFSGSAEQTAREVSKAGGRGVPLICDHADDEQVAEVANRIGADEGRLDILVNNVYPSPRMALAAGPESGGTPFWETPVDSWDAAFSVGVRSHYVMTQRVIPLMLDRGGLIANISSHGSHYRFHSTLYGMGKAAQHRMMQDMAFELHTYPVSVLSLWPGVVRTELTARMFEEAPGLLLDWFRTVWAHVPGAVDDLATMSASDALAMTETPHFTGRAVVALATDPDVKKKSGRALAIANLADEYGFVDVTGNSPDAFRFRRLDAWPPLQA